MVAKRIIFAAYPLSTRHVEELLDERVVNVGHSTTTRWVINNIPQFEAGFHGRKRPVGDSWRLDETYVESRVSGCICIVRSISQTKIDFLLTARRDQKAAKRFLAKAIGHHGRYCQCNSGLGSGLL